ncbi:2-polyprenylphenol 6-hydroxylase [Sulfitobacter mediterraneus]|uniref:2-polyprenylphenol 6-hydroxylase n=1 Tax=Sulfitobacter mediterraneus TaxID=83219 RepID=UPI001933CFC1|nr:2-polyprenylphenol 6-hydroxylase [Sulfitobacter mediterraneus]MBM1308723.1 2-polyprenylphenol 6-hydroxylase [Sulfitobacter mediterraneus]MBM1312608.1 2-polyprenylphenol 6-hydroxylase [Sulfitobacter mediterraneus]MBM1320989.1 2-polyprenylphenol 6-hydroxylase [Sulfitobacter mediterraneus]MBM1324877.1 2-polyprenylphenol 6-hydroxylase [Sulfitobacter mediterraneus]MBM1396223.1 2-polyprenylphenol 6-hydroxylase [Sulfitobacter mediterraneus]
MRGPHNIWRLIRTGATLERTGAMNVVLDAFEATPAVRFVARALGLPFKFLGYKGDPSMPPATRALTALGPAYIKFGQVLSTRPDVVGDDLAVQLRVLQDKLPPFSIQEARAEVERELGLPLDQMFSEFSEPVAAASIAQVHKARIADTGEDVAVKVLRPNIERAFRKDVDAFYLAARMVELFSPGSRRLRPMDVIEHFDGVVRGELDLRLESASASEFAANTSEDQGFQLPAIKWNLSARRVMTLGWADGVPLGDNAAIDAAGHDRVVLGDRVLHLFLNHALRDGFFHADMHQGNLKVAPNGDIIAYDFGIMGHIDEYTRRVYAEILYGFIRRDYMRVAKVHFEAGYVPADKDVDEFARALRAVGEPIFGMDATHISMARLLSYLFEVTERFGMETRTELILLQRTMVVVEGVARSLNPHINIWEVASPIVTDYITKSIGPRAALNDLANTAMVLARFGPRLPGLVEAALLRQSNPQPEVRNARIGWMLLSALGGAALASGAIALMVALT